MMNKISLKVIKLLFLLAVVSMVFSCDEDDNANIIEGTNSIVNYIEKNPRFSMFYQLMVKAELEVALDGNSGTYTLLAPNNEAVELYLNESDYTSINDIPQDLALDLVFYHLLETIKTQESFTTGYLKTLSEIPVTDSTTTTLSMLVNTGEEVRFNGATKFVNANIEVDNGMMHEIDKMLSLPTLETFLQIDENLTPFYEEALNESSDFQNALSSNNYHTLLVPSSTSFLNFLETTNYNLTEREQFFSYHLQEGLNLASRLTSGYQKTLAKVTLEGEERELSLYLNKAVGLLFNGTSTITVQDIVTTNGVIHSLNEVLLLPTLHDFVVADLELETFAEAISRDDVINEGYEVRLNSNDLNAPYTVFAPSNEAFENVLLELYPTQNFTLEDVDAESLSDILNLHFTENLNLDLNSYDDSSISTLGGNIQINTQLQSVIDVNDRNALIISEGGQALNGVLYKLDTVLLLQL
ncbi:fasciclin domain-containing protein [Mesonia aestuariivivens]|uniref:Fasciclin domain-containing protein n=1 Tax=Mesonia aestuariivivens TaxID=2796128 RepID=A0ABS6W4Q7_9FLAO|nr:fasciclin domain-containing protein [Mesonia aestuariivivens]MBW2962851.1 fasciclin domain-containing protein [Mesonia aestuariivivens]